MASAPPTMPMNQSPQYTTTTTARPYTGNSQAPTFHMPNASADSMLMQQRFVTQPGYGNSMIMPNYQSSAGPMPMNANNGWLGQQVFLQTPQPNHQATGFQQKPDLSWVSEPRGSQSADESRPTDCWSAIWRSTSGRSANRRTADRRTTARWSVDWGQIINPTFHADRAPHRHVEAYQ